MVTKLCTSCGLDLPRSSFYFSDSTHRYLKGRCKECYKAHSKTPDARAKDRAWRAKCKARWYAARQAKRAEYNAKQSAWNRAWRMANPEAAYGYKLKRRALKRDAFAENVYFSEIVERDGLRCYLCKTDKNDKLTLEHVIPLSRGGLHCKDNIKLAHHSCNSRKHNKLLEELDWYGVC